MNGSPRKFCLWLFAALLPLALFSVIREKQSWRPREILCGPNDASVYDLHWLSETHLWAQVEGRKEKVAQIWDSQQRRLLSVQKPPQPYANWYFAPSFDGTLLLCSQYGSQTQYLWDAATSKLRRLDNFTVYRMSQNRLIGCSPLNQRPTGGFTVTTRSLQTLQTLSSAEVRPPAGYELLSGTEGTDGGPPSQWINLTPDGTLGAAALSRPVEGKNGQCASKVLIFDIRTGHHLHTLNVGYGFGHIHSVRWAGDAHTLLVTYHKDNASQVPVATIFQLWNAIEGRQLPNLGKGPVVNRDGSLSVAYRPNRANLSYEIAVWDNQSGRCLRILPAKAHKSFNGTSLSPEGNTLAIANANTITLYRLK
jgi:WD40 repeat protein